MENPQNLELINAVNTFYSTSWSHLLTLVYIIGGVGGILLPLATWFYQRRLVKIEGLKLEALFNDKISEFKKQIDDSFEARVNSIIKKPIEQLTESVNSEKKSLNSTDEKIAETIVKLAGDIARINGRIFHEKMERLIASKDYGFALVSGFSALELYAKSKQMMEVRIVLDRLNSAILKHMTLNPFIESKQKIGTDAFENIITEITKASPDGAFNEDLRQLRISFERVLRLKQPD